MISYQFMEHGKPLQKVLQDTPKPTTTAITTIIITRRSGINTFSVRITR